MYIQFLALVKIWKDTLIKKKKNNCEDKIFRLGNMDFWGFLFTFNSFQLSKLAPNASAGYRETCKKTQKLLKFKAPKIT